MTKTLHWSVPVSYIITIGTLIISAQALWPILPFSWGAMFWGGWIASIVFNMMCDRADVPRSGRSAG